MVKVPPSKQLLLCGTWLDGITFQIGIALLVGAKMCAIQKCRSGRIIDVGGDHPLACCYSAERTPRHSELKAIINRSLSTAGVPSILEPAGQDR